jgi:pimeloyl-ACP methyl ester carboxylesterase
MTAHSFTTRSGTQLAYTDVGLGKPIVYLHGLSFDRHIWFPAIAYLSRHYRCIALDLPGHGESSDRANYEIAEIATELHELLVNLSLDRPVVVGHALGGILATVYAADYPVALVVDIDQPLYLSPFIDLIQGAKSDLASNNFHATFARIVPSPTSALLPARYLDFIISQPRQDVVLGYWRIFLDSSPATIEALISATLSTITAPYLAIHSAPVADFYRGWLRSHLQNLEIFVMPEGDRFPHLTDPEGFTSVLARWLTKVV